MLAKEVIASSLFVCLLDWAKTTQPVFMTFSGKVAHYYRLYRGFYYDYG